MRTVRMKLPQDAPTISSSAMASSRAAPPLSGPLQDQRSIPGGTWRMHQAVSRQAL
jgi:hypothetical protein